MTTVRNENARPLPAPGGFRLGSDRLLAADIFVDRELRARIRFLRSTPVLITCFPTRGGNRLDNFPVENEFRRVRSGTRREHPDTRIGSA